MVCGICRTNNPDSAKFCMNCGSPLTLVCANCRTELPPVARFCFNCGHPVGQTTDEPAQSGLHQYIPSELLGKLEAARARGGMVGERRVVTMLFCDVMGSTAAAEQLDPEEWAEIMNAAFEYLISPVYRYEGTVARLMGDAILAFFGAPIAHEDDPERAVLAGLNIVRGIRTYREKVKCDWALEFDVRVGINTGLVVVGEVGSDLRMEYTAMGDAINLAARMESTALPGTVQITEDTYKLVAPLFDTWQVGGISVKGKAEPVTAYRVLGAKPEPKRVRGIKDLETPLIGRDRETKSLRRVLADLHAGRGQIVFLIGDAGLGKSRLIRALYTEWVGAQPAEMVGRSERWSEMGAVSYGAGRPYAMFKHQIREYSGIQASDPTEMMREKLARSMAVYPPTVQLGMQKTYATLLGIQSKDDAAVQLEGEAFKRELLNTTLAAFRAQVNGQPTVYVFDDLHWSDPASAKVVSHLLQLVEYAPVLFLCALRPYRDTPGWQIKAAAETNYSHCYLEIQLDPLTDQKSAALVESLFTNSDLSTDLKNRILRKAEGNPLFIEEVVRTLIDRGIIVQQQSDTGTHWQIAGNADTTDVTIPDSIQALLLARIDRLEEDTRLTLQLAAVIGRAFYYRVLEMLSDPVTRLDQQLAALQRVDLIYELSRAPELEYSFRHTLVREAAYNSILHRRLRQYHRWVGEVVERLYDTQLGEYAAVLAHHFLEAKDDERALKYCAQAADAAAQLYANTEAINHYSCAIEIAQRIGAPNDTLTYLYSHRGRTLEVSGRYDEALANYGELEAVGHDLEDETLVLAALIPCATIYSTYTARYDPEKGQAFSEQALAIAQALEDYRAEAKTYWNLMLLATFNDDNMAQAVSYGERSIEIAREHNLREELAYALHDIARPYATVGKFRRAQQVLRESQRLWRELNNIPMLADNLATTAYGSAYIGDFDGALILAAEAIELSQKIGSQWGHAYSLTTAAPVYLERGEFGKAIHAWETAIRLGEEANFAGPQMFARAVLAVAYGYLGNLEHGLELARRTLAAADELDPGNRFLGFAAEAQIYLYGGELAQVNAIFAGPLADLDAASVELSSRLFMLPLVGKVALANGDNERALATVEGTIAWLQAAEMRVLLPELLHIKGQALLALGEIGSALAALNDARTQAEETGSRTRLWEILATLSRAEMLHGAATKADALRAEALNLITYIAEHAGAAELAASFLKRHDVRSLAEPRT